MNLFFFFVDIPQKVGNAMVSHIIALLAPVDIQTKVKNAFYYTKQPILFNVHRETYTVTIYCLPSFSQEAFGLFVVIHIGLY